jgi:glutathione S-transferase
MLELINKDKLTIVGSPMSPYVRKVLAVLLYKGVPFDNIPLIPWLKEEDMTHLHPMSRIPVLVHGDFILPDSSVIVQYLEDTYPDKPLLPSTTKDAAQARWYEEYADTKLFTCLAVNIFFETFAKPKMLRIPANQEAVDNNLKIELPEALDYLETRVPGSGFMFGDLSLADISLASPFRNAMIAGWTLDAAKWPKVAAYVERVHALPEYKKLIDVDVGLLTVPYKKTPDIVRKHFG